MFDDLSRLRLLHELGRAFAARTDLDDLCRLVTNKCTEVLRAEGVSILLHDIASNELYFPYVANEDPRAEARLRELRFSADHGIAGHCLTKGLALRVDDAESDPRFYHGVDAESGRKTRSLLAAPLKSEQGTVGVLQVVNRLGGGSFSDDDLQFLEALGGSIAVAIDNARLLAQTRAQLAELQRAAVERATLEALRRELDIASQIQQSILPNRFPPYPHRSDIDLFATMIPAREVGGDFYDFFLLDDEHIGLVIGDVSGKGMAAALFMAVTRTVMKATALSGLPPEICLQRVNSLLVAENRSEMFVTLFYGYLDLGSGRLSYCNGGHNPPLLRRSDGTLELLGRTGPLVGALEDAPFHSAAADLRGNETLLLYTDGVTEAFDPEERLYGEDRLFDVFTAWDGDSTDALIRGIVKDVQRHSATQPQTDDITLLALRRRERSR